MCRMIEHWIDEISGIAMGGDCPEAEKSRRRGRKCKKGMGPFVRSNDTNVEVHRYGHTDGIIFQRKRSRLRCDLDEMEGKYSMAMNHSLPVMSEQSLRGSYNVHNSNTGFTPYLCLESHPYNVGNNPLSSYKYTLGRDS